MAWLNASGDPVATKTLSFQIDVPAEAPASIGTINWTAVISAVFQLAIALGTQNPTAIIAAIQALMVAITGG